MIAIRLTAKQLRELKRAAKKKNKRVGEFVRDAALLEAMRLISAEMDKLPS